MYLLYLLYTELAALKVRQSVNGANNHLLFDMHILLGMLIPDTSFKLFTFLMQYWLVTVLLTDHKGMHENRFLTHHTHNYISAEVIPFTVTDVNLKKWSMAWHQQDAWFLVLVASVATLYYTYYNFYESNVSGFTLIAMNPLWNTNTIRLFSTLMLFMSISVHLLRNSTIVVRQDPDPLWCVAC